MLSNTESYRTSRVIEHRELSNIESYRISQEIFEVQIIFLKFNLQFEKQKCIKIFVYRPTALFFKPYKIMWLSPEDFLLCFNYKICR